TQFGVQHLLAKTALDGFSDLEGLTRGSGVRTSSSSTHDGWGGDSWAKTAADGLSGDKFITFGFATPPDKIVSIDGIRMYSYFNILNLPMSGFWQYQINNGVWNVIGDYPNQLRSLLDFNLTGVSGLQNIAAGAAVRIRLVPYGVKADSDPF